MFKRTLRSRSIAVVASAFLLTVAAWAQPKLRLVSAAVGPVNVTTGTNFSFNPFYGVRSNIYQRYGR